MKSQKKKKVTNFSRDKSGLKMFVLSNQQSESQRLFKTLFTIQSDKDQQQVLTFWNLEPSNVLNISLNELWNNELISKAFGHSLFCWTKVVIDRLIIAALL